MIEEGEEGGREGRPGGGCETEMKNWRTEQTEKQEGETRHQ